MLSFGDKEVFANVKALSSSEAGQKALAAVKLLSIEQAPDADLDGIPDFSNVPNLSSYAAGQQAKDADPREMPDFLKKIFGS